MLHAHYNLNITLKLNKWMVGIFLTIAFNLVQKYLNYSFVECMLLVHTSFLLYVFWTSISLVC